MTDKELKELLTKLEGAGVSPDEFKKILDKIKSDIQSMKEIRIYIDNSPNLGHQSSTIALMKQLIDWSGYANRITVFFRAEDGSLATQNKLALLLPGIDVKSLTENPGGVCLSYGTCHQINFAMITPDYTVEPEAAAKVQVPFGFTGGSDSGREVHKLLNVQYFLCLQPYMWYNINRIELFSSESGAESIDLEKKVGKYFKKALFLYNERAFSDIEEAVKAREALWEWYTSEFKLYDKAGKSIACNKTLTEDFRRRIACAQRILPIAKEYGACLWPVYGLQNYRNHCEPLSSIIDVAYDITGEILFNLVMTGLLSQIADSSPIIMLLFNTIKNSEEEAGDFDLIEGELFGYIRAFIAGKDDLHEYFASKDRRAVVSMRADEGYVWEPLSKDDPRVVEADALKIREFLQPTASQKFDGIHILDYLEENTKLEKGHIYILKVGSLPMDLFNFFFWNAGMPPFFEGQGTSSLTILTGRPFLQCSQANNYASYPTTVFAGGSDDPYGKPIYEMVMHLVKRFLTWTEPGSYWTFIHNLTTFINNSYTQSTKEYEYFQALRGIYSAPDHSKLFLGLIHMYFEYKNNLPDAKESLSLPADGTIRTLEDVYAALTCAVQKGQGYVDLPDALKGTRFASYYYDVAEGNFVAAIDLDKIEKTCDSQGNLCQVSVAQGTVSLFHMEFSFSLVFSYVEYTHAFVSVFSCSGGESWTLPGVPWVCLENFGFQSKVYEGDLPAKGCLTGTLKGTDLKISIAYPIQDGALVVQGEFPSPVSALEPFFQAAGGINFIQSMPEPLRTLGGFGLKSLSFVYSLAEESCLSMNFCLETDHPWTIVEEPCFSITPKVSVFITAPGDLQNRRTSFQIEGQFAIDKGMIDVTGSYPDFQVHARLDQGEIDLNSFVEMFGGTIDLKTSVSAFQLDFWPGEHMFFVSAGVRADWELFGLFTIKGLSIHVSRDAQGTGLFLSGEMALLPDSLNMQLYVQGSYHTALKGWQILARQSFGGNVRTGELLSGYLGWNAGQYDLPVADVEFMVDSVSQSWQILAGVQEDFQIPFLKNVSLAVRFAFGKEKNAQGQEQARGLLSADFRWNGIDLLLWYNYAPDVQSFGFTWNQLEAVISKNQASQWVGVLRFTDTVTLGSIIETMVSWIRGSGFSLEAPWNILDEILLSGLELEYNFTTGQVGFDVGLGEIDMGFAKISGIQVSYGQNGPEASNRGVMVTLAGEFPWNVGESASGDTHSLGPWDASMPGRAPVPNGSGNKYFELELLALGQHVTYDGFSSVTKVQDAILLMEELPDQPSANRYDPNSAWMLGADFQILKLTGQGENGYMLRVQTVFNDPVLYALRIVLSGQAAKVLSGLDFQIFYKKIKDNLGVYQADITLPDSIRYINLGGISITLPVISVAVYTNGDFQVDIGFPWNNDFTRSFSIEAMVSPGIPLTGSGGFYFGMLSGETCSRVPQSQKGIFNPVLVFGLGLRVGVGKSFRQGILEAGFSLTVAGILEGVIAKWNPYTAVPSDPDSHSLDSSYYYWLQGTVGVLGWLYGKVDFGIVKASVNIAISLMLRFLVESYRPIQLSVQCKVDIFLCISINLGLFKIKISLSFSAEVNADFLIEAKGQAPWLSHAPEIEAPRFVYISNEPQEPAALDAYLVTALTIAHDEWESLESAPNAQHTCYVAVVFLEPDSFARLCRALLDWLLKTRPDTLEEEILTSLSVSGQNPEPLPLSDILDFLNSRVRITVREKPVSQSGPKDDGLVEDAVYFPMIPWLHMEAGSDTCYTFCDYNEVNDQKLEQLRDYFDQLAVASWDEGEPKSSINEPGRTYSMAEWVFADYFLMLSRQLLKYSLDQLKDGCLQSNLLFERALGEDNLQQLAAMATRYCLHGLRLTTDGIKPLKKGIWVNEENQLPPMAGLFALTGQQFILPARFEPDSAYTVAFTMPQKLSWLRFEDGKDSYTISVPSGGQDAKRIEDVTECWKGRILNHKLAYLGTKDMIQSAPLAFAFSSWQPALAPADLPLFTASGEEPSGKVFLWNFPGALVQLSSSRSRAVPVSLFLEGSRETNGTDLCSPLTDYVLGCLVSFGIQKSGSDECPIYEITGGKAGDILLLERMVSALSGLNGFSIRIGYTPSQGILTMDGDDGLFVSFIKANLSTETRPSDLQDSFHRQGAYESILLLWEALITNQGGFYLYYCICQDGCIRGLPDTVFDEKGRASLSLLVLFDSESQTDVRITNYMNVLVTPDLSGTPDLIPCARTVLKPVTDVSTTGKESIGDICEAYDTNPVSFIERNPDIRLAKGALIRVEQGVYFVRPNEAPGGNLARIEAFFGVTDAQLKAANPGRAHWPEVLEDGQALLLPPVTVTADEEENSSLGRISEKYGCSPKLLAALNCSTRGILAPGQPVSLIGGLQKLVSAVAPGIAVGAFTVTPPVPDGTPQGEALELIMNQYSLLGYHVMENCDYRESNLALPAGPREKDGLYSYTIAVPLTALRKNPASCQENPYNAVGTLVQLDYHWQDLFGNLTASQFSCRQPAPDGFVSGLPVFQGYTDELLPVSSWPCINVSFLVEMEETGQRYFKILFLFDMGKYQEFKTKETLQQYAAMDRKVYQSLYYQMSDSLGVDFQVTTSLLPGKDAGPGLKPLLLDWLFDGPGSIYEYLCALEKGENPSAPEKECCYALPFSIDMINKQDLFRLDSNIEWHRCKRLAAGEFASMEGVFSAVSVLPPKAGSEGGLTDFAQKLEAALREDGSFRIRLASGLDETCAKAGRETLWLVRQGESAGSGISFKFCENRQMLMALRPISNHLEGMDNLSIPVYESGSEIDQEKTAPPANFRAIDLDLWMRNFLTAMDELLSPRMAMAITCIDAILDGHSYDVLTEQKQQMALALKDYLVPMLKKDREKNVDFTRESVRQQLLVKLSGFYELQGAMETAAVVSRGPEIEAGEKAVKLFGTVRSDGEGSFSQAALSSTKLDLQPGQQPFACFIKSPELVRDRTGAILPGAVIKPVFTGSNLEHNFRSIAGIDNYQASGWLNFVTPGEENLFRQETGEFYMPFLLRSYPETPQLGEQDYTLGDNGQGIAMLRWNFRFRYERSCHYPQDRVEVTVHFNRRTANARHSEENGLFASLAAFVSLYPGIQEDLQAWACKVTPDMTPDSKEVVWGNATIRSFLYLSGQVVMAANERIRSMPQNMVDAVTYTFCLRESVEEIQGTNALVACVEGTPPAGLPWPYITLDAENWETVLWKKEPSAVWYWFKDTVSGQPLEAASGQMLPSRRICFPDLYLLCWQSASAQLCIKRNQQEVGDSQVDDCFLYQTGTVSFSDTLYPFIDITEPVDLLTFSDPAQKPKKLQDHLLSFFKELLKNGPEGGEWSVTISLEAKYAYRPTADGCLIELPVFLQPSLRLGGSMQAGNLCLGRHEGASMLEEYTRLWGQALGDWREKYIRSTSDSTWNENAVLIFNLTVFSDLTDTPMPLLHLHSLQLAGKNILL